MDADGHRVGTRPLIRMHPTTPQVMAGPITLLFEGEASHVAKAIRSLNDHFDSRCIDQAKLATIKLKRIIKEQLAGEARKRGLQLKLERLPDGTCEMACEGERHMEDTKCIAAFGCRVTAYTLSHWSFAAAAVSLITHDGDPGIRQCSS